MRISDKYTLPVVFMTTLVLSQAVYLAQYWCVKNNIILVSEVTVYQEHTIYMVEEVFFPPLLNKHVRLH